MEPNRTRTLAIAAALLVVTAVATPAAMAATDSLSIDVDQQPDTGEALVTVTENDTPVENATVAVNPDGNYSANESYETDENGEVLLPNPEETVEVELIAEYGGANVSENVTLVPLSDSLDVAVEQDDGQKPTVAVTQYDDPVDGAIVNVTLDDENASYSGTGEYTTNDDGIVELDVPDDPVDVVVTATSDELSAETQATLSDLGLQVAAWQAEDGRLTVEVTDDAALVDTATVSVEAVGGNYTYDGGGYTATNGTLSLPAPDENVTVAVSAEYDDRTATTTVDLVATTDDRPSNFGQSLGTFIEFIKTQDIDGPLGQEIAEFVHQNNPAADKEPGPPAHVTDGDESTPGQGNGAGPPDHVIRNDTETDDENEANDDENERNDDENGTNDGDRRGPPEHAGNDDGKNGSNNGQGNGPP